MNIEQVGFILITGFLGSGKTTFLNQFIRSCKNRSLGVIVNEWGNLSIDSSLVNREENVRVAELLGGQIFCSCLSGSFVKTCIELSRYNPYSIITEASGLAKPSSLKVLVEAVERKSLGRIAYTATVCIIDASRYHILHNTVAAMDEQIAYSDYLVINKTDLAEKTCLQSIRDTLKTINPIAPIFETSGAGIDFNNFNRILVKKGITQELPQQGKTVPDCSGSGRIKSYTLLCDLPLDKESLEAFLLRMSPHSYRIKGFLSLQPQGLVHYIDCAGDEISITRDSIKGIEEKESEKGQQIVPGVVIIGNSSEGIHETIRDVWEDTIKLPFYLK